MSWCLHTLPVPTTKQPNRSIDWQLPFLSRTCLPPWPFLVVTTLRTQSHENNLCFCPQRHFIESAGIWPVPLFLVTTSKSLSSLVSKDYHYTHFCGIIIPIEHIWKLIYLLFTNWRSWVVFFIQFSKLILILLLTYNPTLLRF